MLDRISPLAEGVLLLCLTTGLVSCGTQEPAWSVEEAPRPAPASQERYAGELGYRDRPDILFILVDTLRADHLGCYGYERPTSPFIDGLAERGIRFERFYSVSPWTNPAIATLFTGRYPQSILPPAPHAVAVRQALPETVPTLGELLREGGYYSAAFVDHPGINRPRGYGRGFDEFHLLYREGDFGTWEITDPSFVADFFTARLDEIPAQPRFIYLHLVYPHRPYEPAPQYVGLFGEGFKRHARWERDGMINRYDEEIRQTDDLVAELIGELARRGLLADTAVLFTSDHGEAFWEHGHAEHGLAFFDEDIRIPLVFVPPGGRRDEPAVVRRAASNIDLFATILDLAGVDPPTGQQGASLLRWLTPNPDPSRPGGWFFSESPHSEDIHGVAAIDAAGRKYIRRDGRERVYDLTTDPDEENDRRRSLATIEPLRTLVDEHRANTEALRAADGSTDTVVDVETIRRLRALGYMD